MGVILAGDGHGVTVASWTGTLACTGLAETSIDRKVSAAEEASKNVFIGTKDLLLISRAPLGILCRRLQQNLR